MSQWFYKNHIIKERDGLMTKTYCGLRWVEYAYPIEKLREIESEVKDYTNRFRCQNCNKAYLAELNGKK